MESIYYVRILLRLPDQLVTLMCYIIKVWPLISCHAPRVQYWVGVGPQGPHFSWYDQKMCPISGSSFCLINNPKLNPLLGLGEAPRVQIQVQSGSGSHSDFSFPNCFGHIQSTMFVKKDPSIQKSTM
jgi:hypothetical protein